MILAFLTFLAQEDLDGFMGSNLNELFMVDNSKCTKLLFQILFERSHAVCMATEDTQNHPKFEFSGTPAVCV